MPQMRQLSAFSKQLVQRMPFEACLENSYFIRPFEHILTGLVFEKVQKRAYLWNFTFPLFEVFDGVNLLYSQRFDGAEGKVELTNLCASELVDLVLSRVGSRVGAQDAPMSIEKFCEAIRSRPALMGHEHARMTLAFGNVLLGIPGEAIQLLKSAIPELPDEHARVSVEVLGLLESGDIEAARLQIIEIENMMKDRLGL